MEKQKISMVDGNFRKLNHSKIFLAMLILCINTKVLNYLLFNALQINVSLFHSFPVIIGKTW